MTLTQEAIDAEREQVYATYRAAIRRTATLALYEIALVARDEYPNSKWVQLNTTDQDYDGGQWVTGVLDGEGVVLADDGEDFDSTPSLDLDNRTSEFWQEFTTKTIANMPEPVYGDTLFLDINKVFEYMEAHEG